MQEVRALNELDKEFPAGLKQSALDQTSHSIGGPIRSISTGRGQIIITERTRYELIRTDQGTQQIDAARMTMTQLASLLSFTVDRPVVDNTGLTGVYRLRVELPPLRFAEVVIPGAVDAPAANEPNAASSFKAVEQLGLRLERGRVPLDTIVVDHMETTPTEN